MQSICGRRLVPRETPTSNVATAVPEFVSRQRRLPARLHDFHQHPHSSSSFVREICRDVHMSLPCFLALEGPNQDSDQRDLSLGAYFTVWFSTLHASLPRPACQPDKTILAVHASRSAPSLPPSRPADGACLRLWTIGRSTPMASFESDSFPLLSKPFCNAVEAKRPRFRVSQRTCPAPRYLSVSDGWPRSSHRRTAGMSIQ
ncbi:hypothetical protein FA95DRAFT_1311961 [Auriscalpium vulgare]|uniref:Uncharacterized protein n=1 Tax=Auriscalpium vulgare TaxID=40419 RepID=A0ACB8RSX6_9AGAM|nr:hypothetical protein FA95DRAFT_1311961 [Auriscalpium vulgare]